MKHQSVAGPLISVTSSEASATNKYDLALHLSPEPSVREYLKEIRKSTAIRMRDAEQKKLKTQGFNVQKTTRKVAITIPQNV